MTDQLEIRVQRNAALHVALRNAIDNKPGWREEASELLMRAAYLPLETNSRHTVEYTTCIDCGSDAAGWRNVSEVFKTPTYMRLCDACCTVLLKEPRCQPSK